MPLSGHDDVGLLNDVANDAKSRQKSMISLKSETVDKLINRIPVSRLLISSLPGLASRRNIESLGKPRRVNKRSPNITW